MIGRRAVFQSKGAAVIRVDTARMDTSSGVALGAFSGTSLKGTHSREG